MQMLPRNDDLVILSRRQCTSDNDWFVSDNRLALVMYTPNSSHGDPQQSVDLRVKLTRCVYTLSALRSAWDVAPVILYFEHPWW